MFDETDTRLEAWTKSALKGVEVSLSPPSAAVGSDAGPDKAADKATDKAAAKTTVSLYLMEVVPQPAARGLRQPPIQAILRYLITTEAADPKKAHRALGELMVAATDEPEFEMEKEPLTAELWSSFGVAPRPAFVLRVPFQHERKERPVKTVRFPLTLEKASLIPMHGKVISTSNIPLAGAKVELPTFKLYTTTDSEGIFTFPAVPIEPKNKSLFIRAKGREFSISTKQAESEGGKLVIQLPMEE